MSGASISLLRSFLEVDLPQVSEQFSLEDHSLLYRLATLAIRSAKSDFCAEDWQIEEALGLNWRPLFDELERRGVVSLKHEHIWSLDGFATK